MGSEEPAGLMRVPKVVKIRACYYLAVGGTPERALHEPAQQCQAKPWKGTVYGPLCTFALPAPPGALELWFAISQPSVNDGSSTELAHPGPLLAVLIMHRAPGCSSRLPVARLGN